MDKLIFDRVLADVENMTVKGKYEYTDLNRINSYIDYLSDYLDLGLTTHTFIMGEVLTKEQMESIIDNINTIREHWYVSSDTPTTPETLTAWDYLKANDIEKILQALYNFAISVQRDKKYSGTFRAGSHIIFRG